MTFRQTKRGATVLGLFWGLALAVSAAAQPQAPERPSGRTAKQAVSARHQMVATANPLATDAGLLILRQGGSAVDAAIAAQMVLNLVEPQSSGIGGGALMLVHDARGKTLVAYDGRETAPAAARPERFLDRNGAPLRFFDAVVGGRSVGVPGTLRMLELAHRRHGRLAVGEPVRSCDPAGRKRLCRQPPLKRRDRGRAAICARSVRGPISIIRTARRSPSGSW